MYNSHMQVCHFAQRGKLPYIYICIVIVSLCFISWHVRLGEWSFSTWCKVDGMLMDTSLLLLKCIGMPCCEFGLACANTSKSLQTWYGSWFKFLFVTSLMQLDNLARASPICTYFPNPSMRCSEIRWFQNWLLTLSSPNSSLTSWPFFIIAFFKARLHTASVCRRGYAKELCGSNEWI